jgi:transcriptional regulator with XRE-family HTH domain
MDIQAIFGHNVRSWRERLQWSQERLSDESGLHRTYISGIERGQRNPTIQIVQKIAQAFNIEAFQLFLGVREKEVLS